MESAQASGITRQFSRELDSLSRELDLIREENRELRELSEGIDFTAIAIADLSQSSTQESEEVTVRPDDTNRPEQVGSTEQHEPTAQPVYRDDPNDIDVEEVFRRRPAPPPTPDQTQPGQRQGEEEEVRRGPQIIS